MSGRFIPTVPEVIREAIIVLIGATLAAWVIGNVPALSGYIRRQWGNTPNPLNSWDQKQ